MAAPAASTGPHENIYRKKTWAVNDFTIIFGVTDSELKEIRVTARQYLSRVTSFNLRNSEENKEHGQHFAEELRQQLGDKLDLPATNSTQTTDEYWMKWGERAAIQLLRLEQKKTGNRHYAQNVRTKAKATPAGADAAVRLSVEQPGVLPDQTSSTPLPTSSSRRAPQPDPEPEAVRSQLPLSEYTLELWDIRDLDRRMEFSHSLSFSDLYSDGEVLSGKQPSIKDLNHIKFIRIVEALMNVDWEHDRLAYPYERDAQYNQDARTLRPVADPHLAQLTWQAAIRTMCGLSPNRVAFVVFSHHDGFTESHPPAWQVNTIDKRDYDAFREEYARTPPPESLLSTSSAIPSSRWLTQNMEPHALQNINAYASRTNRSYRSTVQTIRSNDRAIAGLQPALLRPGPVPSSMDEYANRISQLPEVPAASAQYGTAMSFTRDFQPPAPTDQVRNMQNDVIMSDTSDTSPNALAPHFTTPLDHPRSTSLPPSRLPAVGTYSTPSPQGLKAPITPQPHAKAGQVATPALPSNQDASDHMDGLGTLRGAVTSPLERTASRARATPVQTTPSKPTGTPSAEQPAKPQDEDDVVQMDLSNADDKSSGDIFITIRQGDGQPPTPYTLEQARETWAQSHPLMAFPKAAEVIEPIKLSTVDGNRITVPEYSSTRVQKMSHNGIASAQDVPELEEVIKDIATSDISLSHAITDSLDCSQMHNKLWEKFCKFFRFDPRVRRPEVMVSVRGLKTPLFVYQAYAVYWMLEQCTNFLRGFLLSDDTGLGKTVTIVALLVVRRSLTLANQEVHAAWERKDPKHLSEAEGKQPGAVCPSEGKNEYTFPCPCVNSEWYSRFEIPEGPNLILAPASIVANWYCELTDKLLDFNDKWLNFSLFYAHGQRDIRNVFPNGPIHKVAYLDSSSQPRDYDNLLLNVETDQLDVTASNHSRSRYIALTSFSSWGSRLDTPMQGRTKKGVREVQWSSITIDEFHQHRHESSNLFRSLRDTPGLPFFHFLSATPFERSFADLREPLRCIQRHWDMQEIDQHRTAPFFELYGKSTGPRFYECFFETAAASGTRLLKDQGAAEMDGQVDHERVQRMMAEAKLQHEILEKVMLRRLKSTLMFGRPLTMVPPHERCDIQVPMDSQYQAAYSALVKRVRDQEIREFDERITFQTLKKQGPARFNERRFVCSSSLLLRVCDIFPFLAEFIVTHLDGEEPGQSRAHQLMHPTGELVQQMEQNPEAYGWFFDLIPQLVESSRRVDYFHKLMAEAACGTGDWKGRPEKFLLFTSGPFITACLQRYYSTHEIFKEQFLVLPGKVSDRQKVVNKFNGDVDLQDGTEKPDTSRFMVGTVGTLGTGFTLTRAARAILLQPDWMVSQERQCNGRVDRVAKVQRNQMTFSYRLRDDAVVGQGSLVERSIIARQNQRSVLESLAYGDSAVAAQLKALQERGEAVRT